MKVIQVFSNGNGTVRTIRDYSFNSSAPFVSGEIARIDISGGEPVYPTCDPMYWAWDGAAFVECSPAVRAAVDAANAAAEAAAEEASMPDTAWANLSRVERFVILAIYRLAKLHYPTLTISQFKTQLRDEWTAAK